MAIKKVTLKSGKTTYHVTVYAGMVDGKKKQIVRSVDKIGKARLLERQLKEAVERGEFNTQSSEVTIDTFNDLYNLWWPIYVQTVEGSTAYKTKQLFKNHLLPMFGGKYLNAIKTSRIQYAVTEWSRHTTKAYKERFIYLKKILEFAVKNGFLSNNPANGVEMPKKAKGVAKKPIYWDSEQVKKFLSCIDPVETPEKYTMFLLLVNTGIRREELCGLNVSDIDFEQQTMSITKAYATGLNGKESIKSTKTGASVRTIPLTNEVTDQLKRWMMVLNKATKVVSLNDDRPLFPSPEHPNKRIGINRPNTWLKKIIAKHELTPEISLHGLRKSFITNALRGGVDISTVQRLAGHSTPDMTLRIYAGLDIDDARKGIDKLSKYMG